MNSFKIVAAASFLIFSIVTPMHSASAKGVKIVEAKMKVVLDACDSASNCDYTINKNGVISGGTPGGSAFTCSHGTCTVILPAILKSKHKFSLAMGNDFGQVGGSHNSNVGGSSGNSNGSGIKSTMAGSSSAKLGTSFN